MPAETGVVGLVGWLGEGRGRDAELNRASRDFISKAEGLGLGDTGLDLGLSLDEEDCPPVPRELRGLPSGPSRALEALPSLSLARLDLDEPAVTVCALVGFQFSFSLVSSTRSASGCGFRAWATARGPAHWGIMGSATLARTKLERTVTGRTFSRIFSCRALSPRPKTMCWTLL